jgi:hypothetical protein
MIAGAVGSSPGVQAQLTEAEQQAANAFFTIAGEMLIVIGLLTLIAWRQK